jgi:hypothetical protein
MGSKDLMLGSALTGEPTSGLFGLGQYVKEQVPKLPDAPELPAEVEEVDVSGQKQYTKQKIKSKKGRKSTILSNLGTSNQGKKTVLG